MADKEQLQRLLQGVTKWNLWKQKNLAVQIDLRGADLRGAELRGADLRGADLRGANLRGADLREVNLSRANLYQANLCQANLCQANLRGSDLRGSDLRGSATTLNRETLNREAIIRRAINQANLSRDDRRRAILSYANWRSSINLSEANLSQVDLHRANLSRVNLGEADLRDANLRGADLSRANLEKANLRQIDLGGVNLQQVNFTQAELVGANFVHADLRGAMLLGANLQGAYLQGANLHKAYLVKANLKSANLSWGRLQQANLTGADLSQAILCNANLTQASLLRTNLAGADLCQANLKLSFCAETQFIETKLSAANFYKADATGASFYKADAIGVDFRRAILTGACIEDWNINSQTNLKNVVCEHIYLKKNAQERRPHGGSFQPGEFTQRFQKFLETVDLFFVDGIDWRAFLSSFQDLQSQCNDDELTVQGIERKSGGGFEVRLLVSPEADKAAIEKDAYQKYEVNLQRLEAQYRAELTSKDSDIQRYQQQNQNLDDLLSANRQHNADLMETIKLLASRPITIETTAVTENQFQAGETNQTFNAPVGNVAGTNQGKQQTVQHNYVADTPSLAEAAAEIQDLLKPLESSNPTATEADQTAFLSVMISPTKRQRFIGALKSASGAAIEEVPYGSVLKALVEGWQKPNQGRDADD